MKKIVILSILFLVGCKTVPQEKYFYIDEKKVEEIAKLYDNSK